MDIARSSCITTIVEKRRPLASRIERVQGNLGVLDKALQDLEEERDQLLQLVSDSLVNGRLTGLGLRGVRDLIAEETRSIGKLKARFLRETLNIGVIGRARQGKSRLLQSLSGLTTNEIPDGDGQHCTGVRSTIYHDEALEPHGEVFFYTEKSFFNDVVTPYFRELKLGAAPRGSLEFANNPLPVLPSELKDSAVQKAMYEHLVKYRDHLNSYCSLLGSSPREISTADIRQYVAQDTVDGKRTFFNYLAVQNVKIVCEFPHKDIGRITLIDMPGLGDTGIGDEERLVKVLGQDVDWVLFVRMPSASGDYWADFDLKLYNSVQKVITDLPINQWSFMVLNRTSANSKLGDNQKNCQNLADNIGQKNPIEVVKCVIVDCSNSKEVNEKVLDTLLNYLVENISTLDEQYATACQDRLNNIQHVAGVVLKSAAAALGKGGAIEGEFKKFDSLLKQVWRDLTDGLESLLMELRQRRDKPDERLEANIEKSFALSRQDSGIPQLEEIEKIAKMHGGHSIAFGLCLHKVRTHLVQHFLPLEDVLQVYLENVRRQIADVLKQKGQLAGLSQDDGTAFLQEIAHQIPDELKNLKTAFETLSSVELSYRGFLQYRMRRHLDRLTPDGSEITVSPKATSVREALEVSHEGVLYDLEEAFDDWLCEPNLVAHAIVEEFVDSVLRSDSAYDEWRNFYIEMRAQVWQAEFDEIGERSRLRQRWEGLVVSAVDRNQPGALQFIN